MLVSSAKRSGSVMIEALGRSLINIQSEKKWTKYGTLRYTTLNSLAI